MYTNNLVFQSGQSVDYETVNSYALTIRATDGTHSMDISGTVTVSDINENAPAFTNARE